MGEMVTDQGLGQLDQEMQEHYGALSDLVCEQETRPATLAGSQDLGKKDF